LSRGFKMLMVAENAITDLPPIGFCNEPLLGSKYDGLSRNLTKKWALLACLVARAQVKRKKNLAESALFEIVSLFLLRTETSHAFFLQLLPKLLGVLLA